MNEPQKMERSPELTAAIAERDRILKDMDIEAAKAFIVKHGAKIPTRPLDWERVLHMARFEVTTMPDELRTASQIYLARNGAQSVMSLPHGSPYLAAALNLVFPKDLWDSTVLLSDTLTKKQ